MKKCIYKKVQVLSIKRTIIPDTSVYRKRIILKTFDFNIAYRMYNNYSYGKKFCVDANTPTI